MDLSSEPYLADPKRPLKLAGIYWHEIFGFQDAMSVMYLANTTALVQVAPRNTSLFIIVASDDVGSEGIVFNVTVDVRKTGK